MTETLSVESVTKTLRQQTVPLRQVGEEGL